MQLAMQNTPDLRPSPIAGTWYEGKPETLKRNIDAYLDNAKLPDLPGDVIAVGALAEIAGRDRYPPSMLAVKRKLPRNRTLVIGAIRILCE